MAVQPGVITEDVMTPQGMTGVGIISSNLNQAADRAAAAARQRAALQVEMQMKDKELKAREALAEKELEANTLQQRRIEEHQSRENEKEREARAASEKQSQEAMQARQDQLIAQENKVMEIKTSLREKDQALKAKIARAGTEEFGAYTKEYEENRKQAKELDDALAALQVEMKLSEGKMETLGGELMGTLGKISSARAKSGTLGATGVKEAITEAIDDTTLNMKTGIKGVFQRATTDRFQQAGLNPIQSSVLRSVMDFVGMETPVADSPLTRISMMGDSIVTKLSTKLAPLVQNGTSADLSAGLTNFMAAGIAAQQALASDGAIKGADEEKMLAEFEEASARLGDLVGIETVQGLVDGLGSSKEAFKSLKGDSMAEEMRSLPESEKKARLSVYGGLSRIKEVFELAAGRDGSKIGAVKYDQRLDDFLPKLLDSYAKQSYTAPDFLQQMRRLGMKPRDIQDLISQMEKDKRPVPSELAKKMKQLEAQKDRLGLELEFMTNRMKNRSINRAAELSLDTFESD